MASFVQDLISSSLPSAVSTIEVRSAFSPPYVINVADLAKQGGKAPPPAKTDVVGRAKQTLAQQLRPTIILSGGAVGTQTIAPWGVSGRDDWKKPVAFIVGVLVVSHYAAYRFGRRRR